MARSRWTVVLASLAGAALIYCSQAAMAPGPDVGRDARAEGPDGNVPIPGSCTTSVSCQAFPPIAPYAFDKLAEGDLKVVTGSGGTMTLASGPVDVSRYREAVVYMRKVGDASMPGAVCPTSIRASFTPDADTNAGFTGQEVIAGARIRVDGPSLILQLGDQFEQYTNCSVTWHFTVSGVRL